MANAVDGDFWSPSFEITKREDGTVYMVQKDPLPEALPTIADYLDLWADKAPDRTFLARRNEDRLWDRLTYAESRDKAFRLGSAFLDMGLGPDRPLLILSENSLEHALCALACTYVGIPFAPVSPAYSLISTDHKKLRDIVNLLQPGAIFSDDVAKFTKALQVVAKSNDPKLFYLHAPTLMQHAPVGTTNALISASRSPSFQLDPTKLLPALMRYEAANSAAGGSTIL